MLCALSEKDVDPFQRRTSYLVAVLPKECVAVLIELYKKNITVSCVGSDFFSGLSLLFLYNIVKSATPSLGKTATK